jgi:hypothetical protein
LCWQRVEDITKHKGVAEPDAGPSVLSNVLGKVWAASVVSCMKAGLQTKRPFPLEGAAVGH